MVSTDGLKPDLPPPPRSPYQHKSAVGVAKWFIRFAWMALGLNVCIVILYLVNIVSGDVMEGSDSAAVMVAILLVVFALAFLVILVAVFILGMVWVYRVNKNSWVLRRSNMKFRPGWSVGWWFIPIANIVQPYRIVCELWRANMAKTDAADWRMTEVSPLVLLWWALVIASSVAGRIADYLDERTYTESDLLTADMISIVGVLAGFVMWYLTIRIVREIQAGQNRLATAAVF